MSDVARFALIVVLTLLLCVAAGLLVYALWGLCRDLTKGTSIERLVKKAMDNRLGYLNVIWAALLALVGVLLVSLAYVLEAGGLVGWRIVALFFLLGCFGYAHRQRRKALRERELKEALSEARRIDSDWEDE